LSVIVVVVFFSKCLAIFMMADNKEINKNRQTSRQELRKKKATTTITLNLD
jgi:hypothetical protein